MQRFAREHALLKELEPASAWGRIRHVAGTVAEAEGVSLPIGGVCSIRNRRTNQDVSAEVVGFRDGRVLLVPAGERQADGSYKKGTVNYLVNRRLHAMAEMAKEFQLPLR